MLQNQSVCALHFAFQGDNGLCRLANHSNTNNVHERLGCHPRNLQDAASEDMSECGRLSTARHLPSVQFTCKRQLDSYVWENTSFSSQPVLEFGMHSRLWVRGSSNGNDSRGNRERAKLWRPCLPRRRPRNGKHPPVLRAFFSTKSLLVPKKCNWCRGRCPGHAVVGLQASRSV